LLEGPTNGLLGPALHESVAKRSVPSLDYLREGFLKLPSESVTTAYALSLFAVRSLVRQKGFTGIANYLSALGRGEGDETAFMLAFGVTKADFSEALGKQIERWHRSAAAEP